MNNYGRNNSNAGNSYLKSSASCSMNEQGAFRRPVHPDKPSMSRDTGLYNIVGLLKQATIEVREAGARTLSFLQKNNSNSTSDLKPPNVSLPAARSLGGSSNFVFGPAEQEIDFKFLTPEKAREMLNQPWGITSSVSQPSSPRCQFRSTLGRSVSLASQLAEPKKTMKMMKCEEKPLTILHFNDVYNIEPLGVHKKTGGAARFATAIKEYSHLDPLVFFSGDAFSPSMLSTFTKGKQMIPVLNHIGTDCAVFGNHDFDHGLDVLVSLIKETNFPWLMSNVYDKETGRPLGDGKVSHIILRGDICVGLIGLVEQEWLETLATINTDKLLYKGFVNVGNQLSRQLRKEGCDLIIALTHMRTPNDKLLAMECQGIDLILGGHDHVCEVIQVNGKHIIKSGTDFESFSVVNVKRDPKNEDKFTVTVNFVDVDQTIPEDQNLKEMLNEYSVFMESKMSDVLGSFAVELDGRFLSVRNRETNLGNWVCDVILSALDADAVILNSGTFRSDRVHPPGPFTMADLISVVPMQDSLVLLQVTGRTIWLALENAVSAFPKLEGRFAQVAGIRFAFDPSRQPGNRVDPNLIQIGDEYLDLLQLYKLCIKQYMHVGCDGYNMFAEATVLLDGEACPELPIALRNHFKAINEHLCGPISSHQQSLVSRRQPMPQRLDNLSLSSPSATRKRSPGRGNTAMDLAQSSSQKALRRATMDDVKDTVCKLVPKLEQRIVMIVDDDHYQQLLYKKDVALMTNTISEATEVEEA